MYVPVDVPVDVASFFFTWLLFLIIFLIAVLASESALMIFGALLGTTGFAVAAVLISLRFLAAGRAYAWSSNVNL